MFKKINLNIFRPIIAVLILFIPLYPKFPLTSVDGTYVAIRIDDIVVAIAILAWVIYQLKNKLPVFKTKITSLFMVYFLSIIASFITAVLVYQTDPVSLLGLHLLRRFEYISLFFIALNSIKSKFDFSFAYVFLLISTALVSFYGYGQKYLKFPVISTMNSEFSKGQLLQMDVWTRVNSTFAGHYDLAAFLSVALIVIAAVFLISKNKWLKLFSLLVWIPSFQILTFTASRVSIFAFWGGAVLTFFLLKKYFWIVPVTVLVVFSMFNSKDLSQRLLATIPAFKNQINNNHSVTPTAIPSIAITPTPTKAPIAIGTKITPTPTIVRHGPVAENYTIDADSGVARSGEIRFNVEWPRAINAFKKNPLTGTGLGSISLATDNDYLRLLGEGGLFSFVSFMAIQLFFIIKTIPVIFRKQKNIYDPISIIFLGGLLTTLANAIFIDVFEASKTAYLFWIMMAFYYQSLTLKEK